MRNTQAVHRQEPSRERDGLEPRLRACRQKLNDDGYMNEAIQRLAQELSLEIMEKTYGIPFR